MKIIKAEDIGFCFGVRRAIKKADQAINTLPTYDIYMLGEIIHNPQVIGKFIKKGIHIVNEIYQVPPEKYLITRAHGISKEEEEYAKKNNIILIDTTCPYVKKLHKIAISLQKDNYRIFILGDIDHPEIQSLLSYIEYKAVIIRSGNDFKKYADEKFFKKIGLLSQTTKNIDEFNKIIQTVFNYSDELRVYNTICKATKHRQEATKDLATKVDLMIVIGGFKSANTNRLTNLSKKMGVETYHIEHESQLKPNWFKNKRKIGITSGTSTPDYINESIIKKIGQIIENLN